MSMSRSIKNKGITALALAALIAAAGATVVTYTGSSDQGGDGTTAGASDPSGLDADGNDALAETTREEQSDSYIVVFSEEALAGYDGDVAGYPKAPRTRGKNRIDVASPQARAYVRFLERRQQEHETRIGRALGHQLKIQRRVQHALNAVFTTLTPAEAKRVAKMQGVRLVEPFQAYELETDAGPRVMGAEPVWTGNNPGVTTGAYQGEGMVVGIIDSALANYLSPSFAAVSPADGYQHINPLGSGNFLGTCAPGGVDEGRCNDKLIGGYDLSCDLQASASKPDTFCSLGRETPGFTADAETHGTHVASIAVGNRRDAFFKGGLRRISGVAPRANLVHFDVCGVGGCINAATILSVNQAIADGLVDALNYSITGGLSPWGNSVSLAFLNAAEAGIYVAEAAGNTGGFATVKHNPWTGITAASTHDRGNFLITLDVTGPGVVPDTLKSLFSFEGTGGVVFDHAIAAPLVISPTLELPNDGCTPYPAGTFQGAIAVVRRGECTFTIKSNAARDAGALAVVIANNVPGTLTPPVTGATLPTFLVSQADGNALRDWAAANPGATAILNYPPVALPDTPNLVANFSSRGPAGNYDVIKPDVSAPGVRILAAVVGVPEAVGTNSGTSMSSPMHAGAAALIRQAKPGWSVQEIKSALVMTGDTNMLREDGVTPTTPFDRGGGAIRIHKAINAGLVLHESKANFLAANPALGGIVAALNLPAMNSGRCVDQCSFTRTFRSTLPHAQAWSAQVLTLTGTASPANFTLQPGESQTVTVTLDSSLLPPDGSWQFGELKLRPLSTVGNPYQPRLRLPIALAVPPPVIALNPDTVGVTVVAGNDSDASFNVLNSGGYRLEYTIDNTGIAQRKLHDADGVNTGYRSTAYTDRSNGEFVSDDFAVLTNTRLTSIFTGGFLPSGAALATVSTSITWSIYPDANGKPAGNPQTAPQLAVWSYTSAPTGAGVTITGGSFSLNLAAAGQDVILPAGRYWLVAHTQATFANLWAWKASNNGTSAGGFKFMVVPYGWGQNTAFRGLAMKIDGEVECGKSWLGSSSPASGVVTTGGTGVAVTTQLLTSGLAAGTHGGYVCVASNDPARPKVAALVNVTVSP